VAQKLTRLGLPLARALLSVILSVPGVLGVTSRAGGLTVTKGCKVTSGDGVELAAGVKLDSGAGELMTSAGIVVSVAVPPGATVPAGLLFWPAAGLLEQEVKKNNNDASKTDIVRLKLSFFMLHFLYLHS